MKIEFDLPEVAEEKKPILIKQAESWTNAMSAANLGHRLARLIQMMRLINHNWVLESQKRMLAESLFRYNLVLARIDENKENENN